MKATIRKFILAVNYTIAVVICLALVAQPQMPIIERALYGFTAILIGMSIRRMVKTLMPLDENHMDKNSGCLCRHLNLARGYLCAVWHRTEIFPITRKNPTGVSTDGVLALPITGDHWIAVPAHVQMPCQ